MKTVQLILPSTTNGDAWRTLDVQTFATRGPSRILLVPGALVMVRDVGVLGRTDAQARAATLASLSAELATATEGSVCALSEPRDKRRMAFVMEREALDDLVSAAKVRGYAPDAAVPDLAFLPTPEDDVALIARHGDCLVRLPSAAFACQPDMLSMLLGSRSSMEIDFETAVRTFVREGRHASIGNLLTSSPSAVKPAEPRLRMLAGTSAAAALAIFAGLPWLEAIQLNSATAGLRAQTEQIARAALPDAQRIVNPLAQLREASLPHELAATGLQNAVTVVEGLALSPGVAIARLSYDGEAVSAHVGVTSTSLLQPLRDHIANSGLSMVETPGLSELNSIPVELTVTAAP